MSTPLVRQEDAKGFLLTRFWPAGTNYEIHDGTGSYVRLTEEQARFLVAVLAFDLETPKP